MGSIPVPQRSEDRTIPTEYQGRIEPNYYCRGWRPKAGAYCKRRAGSNTDHPGVGRCSRHDGGNRKHGRYSTVNHVRLKDLIEKFQSMSPEEALDIFPELAVARALLHDQLERFEAHSDALLAWHASYAERQVPIAEDKRLLLADLLDEYEDVRVESRGQLSKAEADKLQKARDFVAFLGTQPDVGKPRRILDITSLHTMLDTVSKMVARWHQAASVNAVSRQRFLDFIQNVSRAINEEVRSPDDLKRLQKRLRDTPI